MRPDAARMNEIADLLEQGKDEDAAKIRESPNKVRFARASARMTTGLNFNSIASAPRLVFSPEENDIIPAFFVGEAATLRMGVG